jgi:erythromycin esterase
VATMVGNAAPRDGLSGWLRDNATAISTLDPAHPLDDLEPLASAVGDARVVAVGESAHFVREFTLARERIVRFLAERFGFTVFAFEFSFSDAVALDHWLQGSGTVEELDDVSPTAVTWGAGHLMRFLREHNRTSSNPVRFVGIDVPEAGGSLRPALTVAAEYLREVDPELAPAVESVIGNADRIATKSAASTAARWQRLTAAEQDAVTAALARILLRFRALEPLYVSRSDRHRYDVALRSLEGAVYADYMPGAMARLFAGTGLAGDPSVRDFFMAESVRWHLQRCGPDTRIVLACHNNHIQRTPVLFDGHFTNLTMGQYLSEYLGRDYYALALTSTAHHIPDMRLDESTEVGFTVADTALGPPAQGSFEAAWLDAGVGLGLADLRRARREVPNWQDVDRIRTQSAYMITPVLDAFDGVLTVPTATMEPELGI